jgi:hypothetical protein
MENYTLYSHDVDLDDTILAILKKHFPKSSPSFREVEGSRQWMVSVKGGGFFSKPKTLTIKYRQRQTPSYRLNNDDCPVSIQLRGLYNFTEALPMPQNDVKRLLLKKIETLNSETVFIADPLLTEEMRAALSELAQSLDTLIFAPPQLTLSKSPDLHFLDSSFRLLMDLGGNTGDGKLEVKIASKYYDDLTPPTWLQQDRKARTEAFLRLKGIPINPHLPMTEDSSTSLLRDKQTIIERMYCLTILAARGEGVPLERLDTFIQDYAIDGLTDEEKKLYSKAEPSDKDKAVMTWRYESLNVLQWALGFVDTLIYPSEICDVPALVGNVIERSRADLEQAAVVRDEEEILDELDKIYRMHWACVEARLQQQPPAGDLNPSIVYERHYALNWLTTYLDRDWDDVSTDT